MSLENVFTNMAISADAHSVILCDRGNLNCLLTYIYKIKNYLL